STAVSSLSSPPILCVAALLAIATVIGSTGCVTRRVQVTTEAKGRQRQWARLCLASAMLSAIVYRGDSAAREDNPTRLVYEKYLAERGWQRRGFCNRDQGDGRGLYFEVWENDTRPRREIIFAFRGTTGGPDW